MQSKCAIVIGAGIVGLATARSLAIRGYQVSVFERNEKAVGASIRNFGMIWPIGQPSGKLYERALRSKSIWKEILREMNCWYEEKGSLHLAYNNLEWQVLQEFAAINGGDRGAKILAAKEVALNSEAANGSGLLGGLFSAGEMIVESRKIIGLLPSYLNEKYGIQFYFQTAITSIAHPHVYSGNKKWSADLIVVCSGADFETLYPEVYSTHQFTKCKLQMMRLAAQTNGWRAGPSLCGGLSLIHYKSFEEASSLSQLKLYYQQAMPEYLKWGIHVMMSQNEEGELTIGDSHEYGLVHEPFDKQVVNQLIIDYLKQFASLKNWQLVQSWNGSYAKKTDGSTEFIMQVENGVFIVNGLGGAGMTLSFGLAEEVALSLESQSLNNIITTLN